jgi:hypothetical protein
VELRALMAGKPKRRHALRSRAALAGVSSVLFVGGIAALASADPANRVTPPPPSPTEQADVAPETTVVVQHVSRTIYVDSYGNVLAGPPDAPPAADGSAAPAGTTPGSAASSGSTGSAGASSPPGTSRAAAAGSPAGRGAPAPGATAKPTAPPVTAAPAPPTTRAPVPPPPTVPKCTGSKCP